jgi:lipopolysaccharide export system protein LptC
MAFRPEVHSRVVAILKLGLPLVALALVASVFLVQTDDRVGGTIAFSEADVAQLGDGLRLTNSVFTGTTASGDRFRFAAAVVVPDAAPPKRAALTKLDGSLELIEGPTVSLSAERGNLYIPTQRLDIDGNVRITSSDGYVMVADKATIDFASGTFVAGDTVATTGPLGEITSGSLHVSPAASTGEARRFSFSNGVHVVYDPPDPERGP